MTATASRMRNGSGRARGRAGARRDARGFTYVGLLVLLAILGLVGAAGLKMGSVLQRAAAEDELLDIGAAFSDALASYAAATPKGQLTQPPTLQELLKDPRFPTIRRHLRKLFVDPITGKSDWGLVRLGDKDSGGIIGVYSLSQSAPLKLSNFDTRFQGFDNKRHLSDWRFMAAGQAAALPPALVPPASTMTVPLSLRPGGPPPETPADEAPATAVPLVPAGAGAPAAAAPASSEPAAAPPAEPVPERGAAPAEPAPKDPAEPTEPAPKDPAAAAEAVDTAAPPEPRR